MTRRGVRATRSLLLTAAIAALAAAFLPHAQGSVPHADAHLEAHFNTGLGFDRCGAMSISEMQTWWDDSPYSTAAVYIGGESLASCFIPDRNWIERVEDQGWGLIFVWVGLQAPCTTYGHRMNADPGVAENQGRNAADAAFLQLTRLGADELGSIEYLDIEAYDVSDSGCVAAVNAFIKGWANRLEGLGDASGLYSNSQGGIRALVLDGCWEVDGCPDNVWMANWNGQPAVWDDPWVPDAFWFFHQRIRQYEGDHTECHGSVCKMIDSNCILGEVAGGENHDPADDPSDPKTTHPAC